MYLPERYQVTLPKFLIVGVVNTALIYALYVALVYAGMHYNFALCLDYLGGILTGYLLNRRWTFRHHGRTCESFLKYCATYGVVFSLNMLLLNLLVRLGLLGPALGQLVALSVVTVISFLLQNFWVFRSGQANVQHKGTTHAES